MPHDFTGTEVPYDERNNPIRLEPDHMISYGMVPGFETETTSGFNKDLGTSFETIWDCGGLWTIHDTLELVSFVSDSIEDATGQTGGITLLLNGIDENWVTYDTIESLTMNGTTPVQTVRQYRFITRAVIFIAGSTRSNVGNIIGTGVTSSNIKACMPPGFGLTRQAITAIPEGMARLVEEISFSGTITAAGSNPKIIVRVNLHLMDVGSSIVIYEETFNAGVGNLIIETPIDHVPFTGTAILEMTAVSDKMNTEVYGRFKYEDRLLPT